MLDEARKEGAAARRRETDEATGFGILPENWDAMTVFLDCGTQWRRAGLAGVPVGLDYSAARIVARAHRVRWGATILAKLQILESAALKVFAAMAKREGTA